MQLRAWARRPAWSAAPVTPAVARLAVALLGVVLLGACVTGSPDRAPPTPPTPAASPAPPPTDRGGWRVAVVLPPEPWNGEPLPELRRRVEDLEGELTDAVRELRVVRPEPGLVEPTAELLADEDYDLVCLLGPDALPAARRLAAARPGTRVCAAPATSERDELLPNLHTVDLRVEEAAFLAGAAAGAVPGAARQAVITGPSTYAPERQRRAFGQGMAEVGTGSPPRIPDPVTDAAGARRVARRLLGSGTDVILAVAGPPETGVLAAVRRAARTSRPVSPSPGPDAAGPGQVGPFVMGHAAWFTPVRTSAPSGSILLTIETRLAPTVRRALEILAVGRGTAAGDPPPSVGLAEGAVVVTVGPGEVPDVVRARVDELRRDLVAGDLAVPGTG